MLNFFSIINNIRTKIGTIKTTNENLAKHWESVREHYDFVTEAKKSAIEFPVPGVQCPNCLKRGVTTWVIPGKNCPRCGTPCSRRKLYMTTGMILLSCVAICLTKLDLDLLSFKHFIRLGEPSIINYIYPVDTIHKTGEVHASLITFNDFVVCMKNSTWYVYTNLMKFSLQLLICSLYVLTLLIDFFFELKVSISIVLQDILEPSEFDKDQDYVVTFTSDPHHVAWPGNYNFKPMNTEQINIIKSDDIDSVKLHDNSTESDSARKKSDKDSTNVNMAESDSYIINSDKDSANDNLSVSSQNTDKSEIVEGQLCQGCLEQGCIIYTMPGEACCEEGHVTKDEPGYESGSESDKESECKFADYLLCKHCEDKDTPITVYPGEECPTCGEVNKAVSPSGDESQPSPLIQFVIIKQITLIILSIVVLSFTNMGVYVVLSGLFILTILALCNNDEKLIPNKTNNNQESVFTTIYNIVINQIDEFRGQWYFPILYAVFIFIVVNNLIGMIPYSFSTTAHFVLTFFLSIVVVLGSTILGIFIHIFKFFSLLVPENCPLLLLALLVFIETISYIARNISLGLRLAANVLSGHMLLNILSGFTYKISKKGFLYLLVDLIPMSFITAFSALEIGIAFIQAQVFSVLSGSYIKDGLNLH